MQLNDIEKQKEHFDGIAQHYFDSRQGQNHLLLKRLMWGEFFKNKQFMKNRPLNVLEPMCGYAEGKSILEAHLGPIQAYEGFDYSDTIIDIVKKRDPHSFKDIFCQDVVQYKPTKTYDVIILLGGLHHVYHHARDVVKNLSQGLDAGGLFINLEPTHNNIFFRRIREKIYRRNSIFDSNTERAFELYELNDMFRCARFSLIDQMYPGLLSYVLYYNPDAFPKLNLGGRNFVNASFLIDRPFFRNFIGAKMSFATLSLWQKG